ncbi:MAG TPA: Rne/Rng family ribonuclease [Mycobacteriales bacterium]|nr:Rne/Rng family ribonuclease [Mycobacteriales bacterium]
MLDTDPTDPSQTTPGEQGAPLDGTAPPPVKAPRRRRATKASAAPAADGPAADSPADGQAAAATAGAPAADAPDDAGTETDAAPRKRAPRKRAPKKAAAAEPAPGDDAGTEPVAPAVEDDVAVVEAAADDTTAPLEPPAPRTRSRVRKAPAVVPFQAPEPAAADPDEEPAPAPRRRRRAGTAGAVSPAELVPTLIEPASAPAADEEPDDEDDADDTPALEDGDRPRRRRRGRRGRGRRAEGEAGGEDSDDGSDDEEPAAAPSGRRGGKAADDPDESAEDGADEAPGAGADSDDGDDDTPNGTRRRRRRRRRGGNGDGDDDEPSTVVHVREPRQRSSRAKDGGGAADEDGVRGISGSTRMAAKRVRRQEGRDSGRRRQPILSEAEFLARREAVDRTMVVRQQGDRTQIAVLEDGVLVEHYVTRASAQSYVGNVYLGRVQNVLPSMEAAFVDIGKGRNAVLYAGEVNWAGVGSGARKIETHLKSGQEVLVQVSKEPIGTKGARLTGQVSLPGRYLVYVPEGSMTGISRKLPEKERDRLKTILKKVVPDEAGVIIRTAAEGASEEEIAGDVRRLQAQWEVISTKAQQGGAPKLLHAEPDLVIRVIRDVFNEDFRSLVVQGDSEWETIRDYVEFVAPDLAPRLSRHTSEKDVFTEHRIDEQLAKALDRKVYLPSGGSLVIDRTEAMVVIDVNTGKYVGKGGNLEETVTRNNLEAAEEIARQLRLRDLGGIVVVDFIDMVLESNRDLVVRRLVECMARDRTKHQVAEVTSLGLVQMTRKRVGQGLLESFSEPCERCNGRGVLVSTEPVDAPRGGGGSGDGERRDGRDRGRGRGRKDADGKGSEGAESKGSEGRDGDGSTADGKGSPEAGTEGGGRARGEGRSRGRDGRPAEDAAPADSPTADRPEGDGAVDDRTETAERSGGRRRRRSGRGSGTATVPPSDEVAELLADAPPDLADQPPSDDEDQPITPPLASVSDPAPADEAAGDNDAGAPPAVVPDVPDAPAAEPTSAPDEPPVAAEAAPRRRRRATSRPPGPPVVS